MPFFGLANFAGLFSFWLLTFVCRTHLYEEDIKCLFLQAVADLTEAREVLMETCQMLLDEYLNTESLDAESAALETEMGTD